MGHTLDSAHTILELSFSVLLTYIQNSSVYYYSHSECCICLNRKSRLSQITASSHHNTGSLTAQPSCSKPQIQAQITEDNVQWAQTPGSEHHSPKTAQPPTTWAMLKTYQSSEPCCKQRQAIDERSAHWAIEGWEEWMEGDVGDQCGVILKLHCLLLYTQCKHQVITVHSHGVLSIVLRLRNQCRCN